MSMQVTRPFTIELIYKGTTETAIIDSFNYTGRAPKYSFRMLLEHNYGAPVAFKVIELNVPINSTKLINWLQYHFKPLFEYDPLMWLASVGTLPTELHQYLIPFHKEL